MSVLSRVTATPPAAQLGALLEGAAEGLAIIDARRRITWCNPAAEQMLGCQRGQVLDAQAMPRLAEHSRAELLVALARGAEARRSEAEGSGRGEAMAVDGQPLQWSLAEGTGGTRLLRLQRVTPESALARLPSHATSEVVRLLWDAPQPLLVQDAQFVLVAANKAFLAAVGLPLAQVLGRDALDFICPHDHAALLHSRAAVLAEAGAAPAAWPRQQWRLRDAQGRDRPYQTTPRWVTADDGRSLVMSILLRHDQPAPPDVAARLLHDLPQWFDLSPVGQLVYDASGQVLRSNAVFGALVGHTPVNLRDAAPELCHLLAWQGDAPHPDLRADAPVFETRASVPAREGGRTLHLRARLRALPAAADDPIGLVRVLAVVEDRSVEDDRDLAQLEIGALMDTAGIGVATYEASRGWTQSRAPQTGKEGAGLQPALQSVRREQVEAGSLAEFDRLQLALRSGERAQVRYEVQVAGLGRRWLLTRVEPGELAGGRAALSVVTLDITEQEHAHRRSEQLLRELSAILEGTSAGMAYLRGERLVRCNPRFETMLGLLPGLATGAALDELLAHRGNALAQARQALQDEGRFETELKVGERWFSLSMRRAPSDGEPEAVAVLTDVSRLKAQQVELEALLRERALMFDLSDVGISHVRNGRIERANNALAQLSGHSVEQLAGLPLAELFEDVAAYGRIWADEDRALRRDGRWHGERRLRRRDGSLTWVQITKRPVEAADAQAGLICSYVDIDERHRAEIHSAQAQASLQRIIETAPLAIALFDARSGQVLRLNAMAGQFFGHPIAELLGQPPEAWCGPGPAALLRADLQRALDGPLDLRREELRSAAAPAPGAEGEPEAAEGAAARAGPVAPRTWDVRVVSAGHGSERQLLLVASDVTEQRTAERERFDAAVSQREMLVKEVHHRIKNNLQGVAGLLQQTAARRPEVATLIREVVGQVQAIAQVHGLQVGAAGPMRIRPLLEAVAASVQRTFGRAIEIDVQGAPAHRFALPEAEAIPIALTINELLTNAVKHGQDGPLRCTLQCEEAEVSFRVTNPGRLREGFSLAQLAPGVSGLGLVRALLPRRTASLSLTQEAETVCAQVRLTPPSFSVLEPL